MTQAQQDERDEVFSNMVRTLAKPGTTIKTELTKHQFVLWRTITQIFVKSGDLLDTYKKSIIYRKELDKLKALAQIDAIKDLTEKLEMRSFSATEEDLQAFAKFTGQGAHAMHMATGIAGEAAELSEAIAQASFNGSALDRENLIEELGDIEFYLEGLRQAHDITRTEVLATNISKLMKRYGEAFAYSDRAAQQRADKAETEKVENLRKQLKS